MTKFQTLSATMNHRASVSLVLVVKMMFANTAAAMPPQLAVAYVSVIDPVTAEASIQSTTAEYYVVRQSLVKLGEV